MPSNQSIIAQQRALLKQLEEEKRAEADIQRLLIGQKEAGGIFVHPYTQRAYRWVGNRLVPIGPRYIDGLGQPVEEKIKEKGVWATFTGALKTYWAQLKAARKKNLGQAAIQLDPWGKPTTHLPIRLRKEIEWEQEEHRIFCEEAPFSRECTGYFGDSYGTAYIYRVDNLITGRSRFPHYAIPYKDKFGKQHLAIGKKHSHLAMDELKRLARAGRVNKLDVDFDESIYGYDHKMLLTKQSF